MCVHIIVINKQTKPDMSISQRAVLTLSDLGTLLASVVEQQLYLDHVDIESCGRITIIGIVSRMIEQINAEQLVGSTSKFSKMIIEPVKIS